MRRKRIRDEVGAVSAQTTEELTQALHHHKERVRQAAAWSLGERGDPAAVRDLLAALYDTDWLVRRNAVIALGKIGDRRAVERLCTVLIDCDANLRCEIITALGWIGDPAAIPHIQAYAEDNYRATLPKYEGQTVASVVKTALLRLQSESGLTSHE